MLSRWHHGLIIPKNEFLVEEKLIDHVRSPVTLRRFLWMSGILFSQGISNEMFARGYSVMNS